MNRTLLSTLSAALLALCLGSGCEVDPADFPSQAELYGDVPDYREFDDHDEDYPGFVLRTPRGTIFTAKVEDGGILGLGIDLGRYRDPDDRAIRGVVFTQRVDLKVTDDRVSGVVSGTLPVDVTATREAGALRVRGRVRGRAVDYHLNKDRLAGTFGRCSYDLAGSGEHHYQGQLDCDGHSRRVRVRLPPELTRWSDPELGTALALLLGGP